MYRAASLHSLENSGSMNFRTIVVVGGGSAGVEVIRGLAKKLNKSKHRLILITSRPRFTFLPATQRLLVRGDVPLSNVFWPYDQIFGGFPGEIIVGKVTYLEENYRKGDSGGFIVLERGERIGYDCAVLATGSHFPGHLDFPLDDNGIIQHVQSWRQRIASSRNIVIVGGGAVGIEMSGEIRDAYPTKNVTLVHNNCLLLDDTYPDRFRMDIEIGLRKRKIDMVFNESMSSDSKGLLPISDGQDFLRCDLLIPARGGRPNTNYLRFLRPSILTPSGHIKVHSTLQVKSHPNIFALGDIVDWPEVKTLSKITFGQSAVVIGNVSSFIKGKTLKKIYKGTSEVLAVSNGSNAGASYIGFLGGLTLGSGLTTMIKSKDLGINTARRIVGLPAGVEEEEYE
ncbi:hypothetical protein CPB83DRAFT_865217 [Crepidotus variabilis]|uniref:FAD/NAD(P)-binding domain-containing protein n=1 Tax=Crepidotus variabilis TaxID=179855 RepID=A0A9P6JI56_9AGAR|nr:hypothetical protein CPB83DRAFT_865217 [Crepidotus variabilis]